MPRYFIHMAYDGTDFFGWQVQPDRRTVQQVISDALSTLIGQPVRVTGAGRTDTGVHASHFVAHFDTEQPLDEIPIGAEPVMVEKSEEKTNSVPPARSHEDWVFKLNRFLPPDIVIFRIYEVPGDMHARYSATYRTYHYHISKEKPLFDRSYALYLFGSQDVAAIRKCCEIILQTSDFTSFSKLHSDVKTKICKVTRADWSILEKGYRFEITADRFLRNMVRSIVGTLLDVGKGKLDVNGFREIVDARDRGRAGQSAPAQGLFLVDVGYNLP